MYTNFKDSLGYNVIIPVSLTTTCNIISFKVANIHIELFDCVLIHIFLITDTGVTLSRNIKLCDTDYSGWDTDDNYIINYIKNNIQAIYNS